MNPANPPRLAGEAQPVYLSYAWGGESDVTTFSLKGELGWRKIAMSAYDEGSISVRGGEEGDACTHRSDPTEY
ncbi:MAG TPA: hypothetical protein VHK27_14055 [Gammaproteobacteria bacterium]|nr:hypothetical protein [Gammaproteobacteria bacterium]